MSKKPKPTIHEFEPTRVSYHRGGDDWFITLKSIDKFAVLILTPDMLRELHATCEEALHYEELSQGPK